MDCHLGACQRHQKCMYMPCRANKPFAPIPQEGVRVRHYQQAVLDALEAGDPIVVKDVSINPKRHPWTADELVSIPLRADGTRLLSGLPMGESIARNSVFGKLDPLAAKAGQDRLRRMIHWLVGVGEFDPNDPCDDHAFDAPMHKPLVRPTTLPEYYASAKWAQGHDPCDEWATPHHRPREPVGHAQVWYRGWEVYWDMLRPLECWVAYKGGCDIGAPQLTAGRYGAMLDAIDEEEDE